MKSNEEAKVLAHDIFVDPEFVRFVSAAFYLSEYRRLIAHHSWTAATSLEDPLTPAQAQAILANGPDEDRGAIAYTKTCPPDVLRALSTSPALSIRAGVAGNPSTPTDVVDKLAQDPDETVRKYAGWNPARQAKK